MDIKQRRRMHEHATTALLSLNSALRELEKMQELQKLENDIEAVQRVKARLMSVLETQEG